MKINPSKLCKNYQKLSTDTVNPNVQFLSTKHHEKWKQKETTNMRMLKAASSPAPQTSGSATAQE